MTQILGLKLILLFGSFLAFNSTPATAQITPDNTLGAERSRFIPNNGTDKINGGALRGSNLFHSFSKFNVNNVYLFFRERKWWQYLYTSI